MDADHPIEIFTSEDGNINIQVALDNETVWLTQAQTAQLFNTSTDNIGLHFKNIYLKNELDELATTEEFSVVRIEGRRQVRRRLKHYNLDAIISVGYRVSSIRATQFRQWSTQLLKQHLLNGYYVNEQRLRARGVEFEQAVALLSSTLSNQNLVNEQGSAIITIVQDYARSWSLLQRYDEQSLNAIISVQSNMKRLDLDDVLVAIGELK